MPSGQINTLRQPIGSLYVEILLAVTSVCLSVQSKTSMFSLVIRLILAPGICEVHHARCRIFGNMNAPWSQRAHSFCDAALECIHGTSPASVLNATINESYRKNAIYSVTTMLIRAQAAESSVAAFNEMGLLQIGIFVKTTTSDGTTKWSLPFSSIPEIQTSTLPSDPVRVPRYSIYAAVSPSQSQVTGVLGRVEERNAIGESELDLQEEMESSKKMKPTNTNVSRDLTPHARTGVEQTDFQTPLRIPLLAVLPRPSITQVHPSLRQWHWRYATCFLQGVGR